MMSVVRPSHYRFAYLLEMKDLYGVCLTVRKGGFGTLLPYVLSCLYLYLFSLFFAVFVWHRNVIWRDV